MATDIRESFTALTGNAPFPWQQAWHDHLAAGEFNKIKTCSLPTGLGKTSVIALWLIALANDVKNVVPRRLVYVVNRRTVVDQATNEVKKLRANLTKSELAKTASQLRKLCGLLTDEIDEPDKPPLAISTLRGQFADNREWSADPSRPSVIVGTVDMIGSRLLFSGYGIGFKSKPLHAGFLGQDVLLVHDEAHLEPAFQDLLAAIEREQHEGERTGSLPWPKIRVMELSATSRSVREDGKSENPFRLTEREQHPPLLQPEEPTEPIHHVWRRLTAKKGLRFIPAARDGVAKRIGELARNRRSSGQPILIFVRTINDVKIVRDELTRKRKDGPLEDREGILESQIQVLTGTLRGLERDRMATEDPVFARFLPEPRVAPQSGTVYLICTSAGEVGIDISGHDLVCDLTTLDSFWQRLGRINRRGDGAAQIDVVYERDPDPKKKGDGFEKARWKTKEILERLPKCVWPAAENKAEDRQEASPLELRGLNLSDEERKAAFAPLPTIPSVTDILFDAWSLTSIRGKMPGRPMVESYLHGISGWEPPETHVAWREEVEVVIGEVLERYKPEDLLDDYSLKPHELLRDRTDRVIDELHAISKRIDIETNLWLVEEGVQVEVVQLRELLKADKKVILKRLAYCTVLLPPFAGGLTDNGMLDGKLDFNADHPSGYDVGDKWFEDEEGKIHRRIRIPSDDPRQMPPEGMRLVRTIDTDPDGDDDDSDKPTGPRYWHWYTKPRSADDDLSKTFTAPIKWKHHTDDVTDKAKRIVEALNMPSDLKNAIALAAKLHDLGKQREVWQRSIGNPNPTDWYAKSGKPKSGKPWKPRDICTNYRHEFGSLLDVLGPKQRYRADFQQLSPDMQDLVLHLIAAHHGRGRPHFPVNDKVDETFDPEANGQDMVTVAGEVPRRFARLQRKYGRWGLAYLESLLRAADYAASIKPSPCVEIDK